jgi:hypothetical protein
VVAGASGADRPRRALDIEARQEAQGAAEQGHQRQAEIAVSMFGYKNRIGRDACSPL